MGQPIVDAYETQGGYPYYKLERENGEDLYMWWMWHMDVGHWVINTTPGAHGNDIIKSTFDEFKCPQANQNWNEFTNGPDGNFVVETSNCLCDEFEWAGEHSTAGTWTKTDQVNDLWPVYQNGNLKMWWMWHGNTVGHWVINETPGAHGGDVAKGPPS